MSLYEATVPQFTKMLGQLEKWLDAAEAFAQSKKFDVNTLFQARLAPDQFAFGRQIQVVCDNAKNSTARLAGKEAPKHADTEQTIAEFRQRIQTVAKYLQGFSAADFADAETRRVTLPFAEGKYITGKDYLNEFALPNFYFHLATAYAILRHNGVSLGKSDFIGSMSLHDATSR